MTAGERRLRAKIGALALHARGGTNTAPARAGFLARFQREVDPDGVLSETERQRRAEFARRMYFARLALASAQARSHQHRTVKKVAPSRSYAGPARWESGGHGADISATE